MKIFLLDLWQDLRDKRLAPVAVVLAVALVAVPVVLSKSSAPVSPAPVQAVRTAPDPKDLKELASVKLDQSELERGSSLNTFDPSDPFRPPKKVTKKPKADTSAPSSVAGNQTAGGGGGTGSTGSTPGGVDTGSTGGGNTGSTGGGGGTGSTPAPTVQYRYVVDVTFSANGHSRKIKGLERLDMLPNENNPLLLFLGVSANAGNAVFLVDSTLKAAGEGKCKPKPSECAFLYIGAGSEHAFTNENGDSYEIRIDEIRKVQVGSGASASRAKRASAAVGEPVEPRRFSSPLIADVVSTSSDSDSTDNPDGR